MNIIKLQQYNFTQQKGTVLLVALIFLLILTLLGVSAMEGTLLETKMAANHQEVNWAFRVAEMGVLQGTIEADNNLNDIIKEGTRTVTELEDTAAIKIRKDGMPAKTTDSQITYKGEFKPTSQDAATASSAEVVLRYFEIESTGQSAGDDQNPAKRTLRVGIWTKDIVNK